MKMKKLLILLSSLIAVVALIAIPVACSHDDDESNGEEGETKVVIDTVGFVSYGDIQSDTASASIIKENDNKISILLSTGLMGLSPRFNDVTITMQGDTSVFYGKNTTDEVGLLELKGYLFNSELYLQVTGGQYTDTLVFATNKDLLSIRDNSSDCKSDIPTDEYLQYFDNAKWAGKASYDGADPVDVTFSTTLAENGVFAIDLGECQFSASAPKMNIKLNDMCFFLGNNEPDASFKGAAASYNMYGMEGSLPADVSGSCADGKLQFKVENINVAGSTHSIVITDASVSEN